MLKAVVFDFSGVLYDSSDRSSELIKIIKRLRPTYKIGLFSNSSRRYLEEYLAENHLRDLFDAVVSSTDAGFYKTERGAFQDCAARLEVDTDRMLFVDDWPGNINAATSYGIRSILYEGPKQLEQELRKMEIHLT
jgi:HAD superfamily hydrolase (TIGR01509 family)